MQLYYVLCVYFIPIKYIQVCNCNVAECDQMVLVD